MTMLQPLPSQRKLYTKSRAGPSGTHIQNAVSLQNFNHTFYENIPRKPINIIFIKTLVTPCTTLVTVQALLMGASASAVGVAAFCSAPTATDVFQAY
jgi:hypothetical protein